MYCAGNYAYRIQQVKVGVFKCSGLTDNEFESGVKRKNQKLSSALKIYGCPRSIFWESHPISKSSTVTVLVHSLTNGMGVGGGITDRGCVSK